MKKYEGINMHIKCGITGREPITPIYFMTNCMRDVALSGPILQGGGEGS